MGKKATHWWRKPNYTYSCFDLEAPMVIGTCLSKCCPLLFFNGFINDHLTHEIESPWPLHFKHSHRWKSQSRSKFTSHYVWGTNGVCECKINVNSTWTFTWHQKGSCFMVIWCGVLGAPPSEWAQKFHTSRSMRVACTCRCPSRIWMVGV